ncbi:prolipoprotein diacylglyceryl transferase [Fulvivirga sp. 29W222]|uniref:Prolipoprotein diacylglyceryl transferase n=1 Tax=Fulvivirga marina TaxID=2494733 RepID=A0A937FVM9_9BACT|nr:DUF6787 family protein [Fulvivirga marina]MBL6446799.1 prolipoprotein diacylglyceryl transferase [Fulvivirga marina]
MRKPGWLDKLERRWNVTTIQAIVILIVFACTGFTVLFLKEPILSLIAEKEDRNWVFTLCYYLLILPVYNTILLVYGFLFGQFNFFWEFEKRMFRRMFGK